MRRLLPAIFALFICATAHAQNGAYQSPSTASGGGGSGTVTSIVTSAPLGGGTITTSGTITCITCAVTSATLAQFAATTSAQLASVISDETGTGLLVFATSPVLTTPNLGTPSAINLTNATSPPTWNQNTTGTASNLSGTPALPNGTTATTQTVGDNTTKLATTAFVLANAAGGGVSSFSGDGALLSNSLSTGAVTATLGTAGAHKFWGNNTGITATPAYFQPAFTDLSGSATCAQLPALTGDTTTSAGTCATTTAKINGTAFSGTSGNLVSFGAANIPADSGFLATNVVRKDAANTGGASMTLDMSASATTAGHKVPVGAGAVPTADGAIANNSTNHTLVYGSNGTTLVSAVAATSTGTATTCTNQVVTAVSGVAAPTCTTLTSSFLPAATTTTVASGTSAMGTGAITSGTCATVVTTSATGVATTDAIQYTPNADPTSVTGYAVSATGSLYIWAFPTANNVNFKVCNNTSGSLTPAALTLNWRVVR